MKKRQWFLTTCCGLLCAAAVTVSSPAQVTAAPQQDRSAYRAVFDADYYYNAYPDVAAAIGRNTEALFNHFVSFGVREGRSASAEFNPQAYRQKNADLQTAFGSDMAAYCRHYINYGKAEGRSAGADGMALVPAPADTTAPSAAQDAQTGQPVSGQILGSYTTYYIASVPRAINVELAAQRINGVVVQPGAGFSFSQTILPRTSANGYVTAPIFVSGKKGTGIGGGVCQVSSTLYAAMVTVGLPATERHPHSLPVDYLPKGLDATIAGNYLDLKFTNIYAQPLVIQASASEGRLVVTLSLQ